MTNRPADERASDSDNSANFSVRWRQLVGKLEQCFRTTEGEGWISQIVAEN